MTVCVEAGQFAGAECVAVQAGEAAPFQSPAQVHVAEAPAAGKAGEEEAVHCPQYASVQKEESR